MTFGPDTFWDPIVVAFAGDRLVLWGRSRGPINGAVLDARAMKWDAMPKAPVSLRYRALQATIGRKVVVWGGHPNFLQDGAVFDTTKNTWKKMAAAPVKCCSGTSCAVWRGRFVVFGGNLGPGRASRAGAIYDPESDTWKQIADAPSDVGVQSAFAVCGDRLFVWSGAAMGVEAEGKGRKTEEGAVYDLLTRRWEKLPKAPIPPRVLGFAQADKSRVVVWGGWISGSSDARSERDGAVYDLGKKEWRKLPEMPGTIPMVLHPGW